MPVSYRIDPDTVARLRAALVAPADQQRLRAYTERLATVTQGVEGDESSLAGLLPPMFALAAERSAAGGDAVAENRAALLSLTFFANDRPLGQMVPAAYHWPRPQPLTVTLRQRQDFALHFLISAVIAAEAGTPLADAVGLWKELADARRGGSGFSFNDLAADRAGTRFGELARARPGAAAGAHRRRRERRRPDAARSATCRNACRRPSSSRAMAASAVPATAACWPISRRASTRCRCSGDEPRVAVCASRAASQRAHGAHQCRPA